MVFFCLFDQFIASGCGLDVHKKEIVATISGDAITTETRSFGSTTSSLTELKDWLLDVGVTMESTGVYWRVNTQHLGERWFYHTCCQCTAKDLLAEIGVDFTIFKRSFFTGTIIIIPTMKLT